MYTINYNLNNMYYNTKNLQIISQNIARHKSNIYNKNKIKRMIARKESYIHLYYTISKRLTKYKIYLEDNFHQPNINIKKRVKELKQEMIRVTEALDFIEKEEALIMKVFNISTCQLINCINNLKNSFKIC